MASRKIQTYQVQPRICVLFILCLTWTVNANSLKQNIIVIKEICSWLSPFCKHTPTHQFNGPFSGTTQVSRYQKGEINLDFTEARDSEWQWHQLGHMQVCTSLQTDNHASTPPLKFLQAGCPSCRPTNSVKALKAIFCKHNLLLFIQPRWQPFCARVHRANNHLANEPPSCYHGVDNILFMFTSCLQDV